MAVTRADIEKLIRDCRITSCLECGKCTAICPLSQDFGDDEYGHSPRGIIEMALLDADLVMSEAIWHCLTCVVCTDGCPSGVRFRDFVEALRRLALANGYDSYAVHCSRCGDYFLPVSVQGRIEGRLGTGGTDHGGTVPGFMSLCPRCRSREFAKKVKDS